MYHEIRPMYDIFKDIDITMNYAIAQGHVTETDRAIRTIKESFRALYHQIPYSASPKVMARCGANDVMKWLNMFPPKGGVCRTYSLGGILPAKPVDYKKYRKIRFWNYGQLIHENNPTNPTTPRTLGVIYLRSLDILRGGFEVINLLTGKIISCFKVTLITITEEVIDRVKAITKRDGIKSPLMFKDHKEGNIREDDDENDDDDDGSIAGVKDEYED